MGGLENITVNNGWAMAVVGYATVICSLAILATLISFMPKIILLVDTLTPSKKVKTAQPTVAKIEEELLTEKISVLNTSQLVAEYGAWIGGLGVAFDLKDLYALAREKDLEHPHLSIKTLQEAGKIVPDGEGLFKWNA